MSKKIYTDVRYDSANEPITTTVNDTTITEVVPDAGNRMRSALRIQFKGNPDVLIEMSSSSDLSNSFIFKAGDTYPDDFYQQIYYAKVLTTGETINVVVHQRFQKSR